MTEFTTNENLPGAHQYVIKLCHCAAVSLPPGMICQREYSQTPHPLQIKRFCVQNTLHLLWHVLCIRILHGSDNSGPRNCPACPDCGGNVAWAGAGRVPGSRECMMCDSRFADMRFVRMQSPFFHEHSVSCKCSCLCLVTTEFLHMPHLHMPLA